MKVLIYEDNLIWSSRLALGVTGLGHQAVVLSPRKTDEEAGDVAVINLATPEAQLRALIDSLVSKSIKVVGHAGHKERPLMELGHVAGCDRVVNNGELTHKLAACLDFGDKSTESE